MTWLIMRSPCLPEDEGRSFVIKTVSSEKEADEWIKKQEGEYFRPSDYYKVKVPEKE